MIESEIDTLEAGRELDALIAERVIKNVRPRQLDDPLFDFGRWLNYWCIPTYSTTWGGAGQVWEAIDMPIKRLRQGLHGYTAAFGVEEDYDGTIEGGAYAFNAPSPMVAICRAALKVNLLTTP